MTLAFIGLLAWITTVNFMRWRATRDREIRWKLYALRDELRSAAMSDRRLLQSQIFWKLDKSLTQQCAMLENISLWLFVPFLLSRVERQEARKHEVEVTRELSQPQNAAIRRIFEEAALYFGRHLILRHLVLFLLLAPTVPPTPHLEFPTNGAVGGSAPTSRGDSRATSRLPRRPAPSSHATGRAPPQTHRRGAREGKARKTRLVRLS